MKYSTIIKARIKAGGDVSAICDERNRRVKTETGSADRNCDECPFDPSTLKAMHRQGSKVRCTRLLWVKSTSIRDGIEDAVDVIIGEILLNLEAQGD